jgi:hypothetical protein
VEPVHVVGEADACRIASPDCIPSIPVDWIHVLLISPRHGIVFKVHNGRIDSDYHERMGGYATPSQPFSREAFSSASLTISAEGTPDGCTISPSPKTKGHALTGSGFDIHTIDLDRGASKTTESNRLFLR